MPSSQGGGVVELCTPKGIACPLAVFADGVIEEIKALDETRFLLTSRKGHVTLVDCEARSVSTRIHLPGSLRVGILAMPGGNTAFVWSKNSTSYFLLELPSLAIKARFNLAERIEGERYRLVYRSQDELEGMGAHFQALPAHGSPLRRIVLSNAGAVVCRSDGTLVLPVEYKKAGREFISHSFEYRGKRSDITENLGRHITGVCEIDTDSQMCLFKMFEDRVGRFATIHSFSPDGRFALVNSASPLELRETALPKPAGFLKRTFGRRAPASYACGLDVWDIGATPQRVARVPVRPLLRDADDTPPPSRRIPGDIDAAKAGGVVVPGLRAAVIGRSAEWMKSREKQEEDEVYLPHESQLTGPRKHYPESFICEGPHLGNFIRRIMQEVPEVFSELPWQDLTDRQMRVVSSVLKAWEAYASREFLRIAWTDRPDTFLALTCRGTLREIHMFQGPGPEYRIEPLPERKRSIENAKPYSDVELKHLGDRKFALEYPAHRLEFDVPPTASFTAAPSGAVHLLQARIVVDRDRYSKELKIADRLAREIRPGYVTIKSLEPQEIIVGVKKLTAEVTGSFEEMAVENRWQPTLFKGRKQIREQDICDILLADGGSESFAVLSALLDAYLVTQETRNGRQWTVWHEDDVTPALVPTAFTLIEMTGTVPDNVNRLFGMRDMEHDTRYTPQRFASLKLTPGQLASEQLFRLRLRLAVQDVGTGNNGTDLANFYGLKRELGTIDSGGYSAKDFAEIVKEVVDAQAPDFDWASPQGPKGMLETLANGLKGEGSGIATLKDELRKRRERLA